MRILQVARYGSVAGGTEAYIRELCAGLATAGHEVALAYRFDPDLTRPEVRNGMQLGAITSRNAAPTATERNEVGRAVAAFRPDVIHVHNVDAPWLPGMLNGLAPAVHGVHDHRLDCPTGTRYLAAWGRACDIAPGGRCLGYNVAAHCGSLRANATLEPYRRWRRAQRAAQRGPAIQVFSDYMRGEISRAGIRTPVTVTPYPAPAPVAAATIVEPDPRPVVFATGRLTKEKGFDLLLASLDRLQPAVHVVIGGTGHHGPALAERATAVPARHRVSFPGWLDPATVAGWYGRASVFAMPSAWPEPFGIVGLEAASAGLPVVATDVGGVRQWLADGLTGIAVPPRDPAAFAGALHCLLANATLRRTMGAAAREHVKGFSLEHHVTAVLAMYEQARRGREVAA